MCKKLFVLGFALMFALTSCQTVKKTIESGDYDKAIDLAVNHLKGQRKKSEDVIKGLELALDKANNRDLNTIEALVAEQNPQNWERINGIYLDIQKRQAKIYPLLPLRSKKGYEAQMNFADVASLERESRQKAVEYLYAHAKELLKRAETTSNKISAREAYDELKKINCYITEYCDTDELLKQAKALGTSHILVETRNQSAVVLPRDFEYRMMHLAKSDLESAWLSYHFDISESKVFDYKVVIKLNNIDVSPERINTREYRDERRVEDGWEYELDAKGNVKKDTLEKDIKKKKYSEVYAYVRESFQTKAAKVGGDIEIYDFKNKALLDKERITTEVIFEHYASSFNGDRRALSDESYRRIGNRPLPFPTDLEMLDDAADQLKPKIRERLRGSRMIL
jgi:hypothetical protein